MCGFIPLCLLFILLCARSVGIWPQRWVRGLSWLSVASFRGKLYLYAKPNDNYCDILFE